MAYHGVLIPEAIAALNIDAYNRSFMCSASSLDNGMVFQSTTRNWASGSGAEVFNIAAPATGSLVGLWMVYAGDEVVVTDLRYKGLDPDPRNFYIAQGKVFSGFKVNVGDIILATADAFTGSPDAYANAANGAYQLTWGTTPVGTAATSFKKIGTKYISLGTGGIDSQRVTAYELECIIA
jgi:hypothetical protein